ncbi:hypothetical protein [Actinomadura geliboluensis]|uniref:hypothetical protein n=1 Tax=Actinomadura geliboluensis TaxID=882440 RepID=UPI00368FA900
MDGDRVKSSRKLGVAGVAVAVGAVATTVAVAMADPAEQRTVSSVAAAAGTTWPIVQSDAKADQGTSLSDIATAPDGTVWAVGGQQNVTTRKPILQRLTGGTWKDVALPASLAPYRLQAASATSASNVWVAAQLNTSGDSHALLRWTGSSWIPFSVPLGFQPTDIATAGPDRTWAVSAMAAKYWNGAGWADTPIGIKPRAVAAVSSASAWAVGWAIAPDGTARPATTRWNGTSWTSVPFPDIGETVKGEVASTLQDVYAASDDDVWAVGTARMPDGTGKSVSRSLLAHWNGTKWTNVLGAPGTSLSKVASDGAGGIWVVSDGSTMRHRTAAGVWTDETLTRPEGTTVRASAMAVVPGTGTMWAVGTTTTDATRWADLAHWTRN